MKVLLIGEDKRINEAMERLQGNQSLELERSAGGEDEDYADYDLLIDLNFDDDNENLRYYGHLKNKPVIVCAVKQQLAEAIYQLGERVSCLLIGMNALPTFINRENWELSLLHKPQRDAAEKALNQLGVGYHWVDDRVGMVTPRVIFMIINEACYTLQEGTAGIADIDLGMKLGTNYPMGPFEWADKVGITDVFETLMSIYEATKNERYRICPLLRTHYLKNQPFLK